MKRHEFRRAFGRTGQVVLPVVHVYSEAQTTRNVALLVSEDADGCWLINHHFDALELIPVIETVRKQWPDLWLGVNFLGMEPPVAFEQLALLEKAGIRIDGYWADNAGLADGSDGHPKAAAINAARSEWGWGGLFFGGVAFKYQAFVPASEFEKVAEMAVPYMDVVTTSGPGTGAAAHASKIASFRKGAGQAAIALASGVTPENASDYRDADCFIVATGINKPGDFFEIDAARLRALLDIAAQ